MSDQNNSVFEQRVASLRELLDQNDLDALIVSHDDEYLSYELNEDEERLKYITGFSGSAGYAVITRNDLKINEESIEINQDNSENSTLVERDCAVFVDGRYVVQVKEQIDTDIFQDFDLLKVLPVKWILSVMPKNSTVGIDINCVSYKEYISIKNELGMNNINLVATENNLVDKIWTDKPAPVISEISIFPY